MTSTTLHVDTHTGEVTTGDGTAEGNIHTLGLNVHSYTVDSK